MLIIIIIPTFAVQFFQQFTIRTSVRCENIRSRSHRPQRWLCFCVYFLKLLHLIISLPIIIIITIPRIIVLMPNVRKPTSLSEAPQCHTTSSIIIQRSWLPKNLFSVLDVDALCRSCYATTLQVVIVVGEVFVAHLRTSDVGRFHL